MIARADRIAHRIAVLVFTVLVLVGWFGIVSGHPFTEFEIAALALASLMLCLLVVAPWD